jgi:ribosomal protein S18 acetylase RimI-like enzyme
MGEIANVSQADITIVAVTDARRPKALELLLGAAAPTGSQHEVIAAFRDEQLLAATGIELAPGRTANLLRPRFVSDVPSRTTVTLLQAALAAAWRRDAVLVQTLLETDAGEEAGWLHAAGFRHIADLLYLVSTADSFPKSRPQLPVTLRAFDERDHAGLAKLIERTYQATQDCPILNGVRTAEDVVAGYRAVGEFRAENWLIASDGGRDVGCVLLADHSAFDQVELVYLGVILAARGRRLGYELTRHAQWMAREAHRGKLVLAVDANNEPALRLYAQAGFQSWDRRSVFVAIRPISVAL